MKAWYGRAVLYVALLSACVVTIWPPFARNGEPGKIKLGLDLRGGTYLVLQVMPEHAPRAGERPIARGLLKEVIRTLERRVDQLGVAEAVITEYGRTGDQVLVQLPGIKDVAQAKRLLIGVAQLSLRIVEASAPTREALLRGEMVPPTLQVLEGQGAAPADRVFYLVHREALMTGRDLKTARVGVGDHGEPNVQFTLSAPAASRFREATGRHIGRRLAIVLDERVTSAPVIEEAIGAEGQIRGRFTATEADELAKVLRAGALPAKMRFLHELTVGASLGRDSIRAGVMASAAAMLLMADVHARVLPPVGAQRRPGPGRQPRDPARGHGLFRRDAHSPRRRGHHPHHGGGRGHERARVRAHP